MRTIALYAAVLVTLLGELLAFVLSGCGCALVPLAAWVGLWLWLVMDGHLLLAVLWFVAGAAVVLVPLDVVRFPFLLLGLALAALAGRQREFLDAIDRTSRRSL